MKPIPSTAVVKILIHSLFWVVFVLVVFVFNPPFYGDLNMQWFDKIEFDMLLLIISVTYLNDFLLLPYFFKRRLYAAYGIINAALLFFTTAFYCYALGCLNCKISVCYSNYLWIIALPIVLLSLVWVVIEFYEKQKELEKAHSDRLEMELKFLKSQINPHVLFNSLNTIYAQAIKENDTLAEMILMLSDNLKYVLNQSNDILVDVEKDITFIENHLEFQKLRTQGINKIVYSKEIDSYGHSIAPLILIDLIENAFKYAAYNEEEASEIRIAIKIKNGKLHFVCKNEFDAITTSEKENTTEIGLNNIRQRLRLIYKDKYTLRIDKTDGVYSADLKIELK